MTDSVFILQARNAGSPKILKHKKTNTSKIQTYSCPNIPLEIFAFFQSGPCKKGHNDTGRFVMAVEGRSLEEKFS